jgi:hypothetical protein
MADQNILDLVAEHLEEVKAFAETDANKLEEFRIKYPGLWRGKWQNLSN